MNGLFGFIGACVCAACIGAVLKQLSPKFLPLYYAIVAVLCGGYVIKLLAPVADYVKQLTDQTAMPSFFGALYKAVGVSLLCGTASEVCKACGENALAGWVESAGKAVILLLSLPAVKYILESATKLSV